MRRILFDTNILIPYLRNPDAFTDAVSSYDCVILTPTVLGEFRAGITTTKQGMENLRALDDFLLNPAVEEWPITSQTSTLYARIFQMLKQQGTPIPTNDIWIAAVAMQCGCDLFTHDEHFVHVQGLRIVAS